MIDTAQIDFYREHGYLVVPDVLNESEIAAINSEIARLVEASREVRVNDDRYDLEDDHCASVPRVRRLKGPHRYSDPFAQLRSHPKVIAVLDKLWNNGIRFDMSKLNMKEPGGGAAVEWHQDWAFYPHTNDDLAAVGFMLDDMTVDNGPLMIIPGSHTGPIYDHHTSGRFCGAIDPIGQALDASTAVELLGRAGSITVHHVRAVHGSAPNLSDKPRKLLLHQYCAADAWPLLGVADYEQFTAGLVSGGEVACPRMESVPVRVPYPIAMFQGSIYENQRAGGAQYFSSQDETAPARKRA